MTLTAAPTAPLLTDEMLERFDARAPLYDRDNQFFQEDFDELRASGYLSAPLPVEFGGSGLDLAAVNRLQRRLAYVAPATAVAVNMHLYWVGLAADLHRSGDDSCGLDPRAGRRGPHLRCRSRRGRQRHPGAVVQSSAARVDGGWELSGHKIFGSLSPVWTYLGVHAMDTSDPTNPRVVHGFLHRDEPRLPDRRDLGHARHARHAVTRHDPRPRVRARRRRRRWSARPGSPAPGCSTSPCSPGRCSASPPSTPRSPGARSTRCVAKLPTRRSVTLTRTMAHHPEVQHHVAEMRIQLEAIDAHLDRVCDDWSSGVDHGEPMAGQDPRLQVRRRHPRLGRRRHRPRPHRRQPASSSGSRIEQLFRDARLGRIHPGNTLLTHELVGKLSLGIDPDEQPRWG